MHLEERLVIGKNCLQDRLLKDKKLSDMEIEAYMLVKMVKMKSFAYMGPTTISQWIKGEKTYNPNSGLSRRKKRLKNEALHKVLHKSHPNGLVMVVHDDADHWFTVILQKKEEIWQFLIVDSAGKKNSNMVSSIH